MSLQGSQRLLLSSLFQNASRCVLTALDYVLLLSSKAEEIIAFFKKTTICHGVCIRKSILPQIENSKCLSCYGLATIYLPRQMGFRQTSRQSLLLPNSRSHPKQEQWACNRKGLDLVEGKHFLRSEILNPPSTDITVLRFWLIFIVFWWIFTYWSTCIFARLYGVTYRRR